jgi:hypothetical protein
MQRRRTVRGRGGDWSRDECGRARGGRARTVNPLSPRPKSLSLIPLPPSPPSSQQALLLAAAALLAASGPAAVVGADRPRPGVVDGWVDGVESAAAVRG